MEIFHQVIKKAQKEGEFDPRGLPWEASKKTIGKDKRFRDSNLQFPPHITALPQKTIYDLRKITENVLLNAGSKSAQVIGFTSAIPNQGTSTLIALISLLAATRVKLTFEQSHRNNSNADHNHYPQLGLLLIDSQLQNPVLHRKLGLEQKGGLLEMLEQKISYNKAIKKIAYSPLKMITHGNHKNFHITQNHLLKLSSILKYLKHKVEFIFLDIPPLLTCSESISLSRLCDGIVIVSRAGKVRSEVLQEAKRLAEKSEVNIIGGVLNRREYFIPNWMYRKL